MAGSRLKLRPKSKGVRSKAKAKSKFRLRNIVPKYFVESFEELKKVTWPSRKEAWSLTLAVFIYSFVYLLYIIIIDDVFKNITERLFLR